MRNNYLEHMDIVVWRLRERVVAQKYFQVVFNNSAGIAVGLLLADIENDFSLEAQKNLLQKITDGLKIYAGQEPYALASVTFEEKDLIFTNHLSFIILLGNKIKKIVEKRKHTIDRVIFSYSLFDLIQNPDCKKQLWLDIKSLREFIG